MQECLIPTIVAIPLISTTVVTPCSLRRSLPPQAALSPQCSRLGPVHWSLKTTHKWSSMSNCSRKSLLGDGVGYGVCSATTVYTRANYQLCCRIYSKQSG